MTHMSTPKFNDEYLIENDEDGHWYVIRADQLEDFNKWLEATSRWEETDLDFEPNRIQGHPNGLRFREWRQT